jgi:hypothetical protein
MRTGLPSGRYPDASGHARDAGGACPPQVQDAIEGGQK